MGALTRCLAYYLVVLHCACAMDVFTQNFNATNQFPQNTENQPPPSSSSSASSSSSVSSSVRGVQPNLVKAARIDGDFLFGGLFPVHKKGPVACGGIQPDRGIQRVEAMLYTVDHINRNPYVLPDLTLGASILDTCSRDTYALDQALEFVRASSDNLFNNHPHHHQQYRCEDGSTPTQVVADQQNQVVGVVGGSYSSVSIQVANLLRLFKIPQISYASTSVALSDKTRYEYFARTVPPDSFQARAMADVAVAFNWTYVNTVASEGDYGEMGIDAFRAEARARNICIAVSEKVASNADAGRFDEIVARLLAKPTARVVVLFLRIEDARELLLAARRHGSNATGQFVWVASDGWGKEKTPVRDNEVAAEGALTFELQSAHIPEFDVYFRGLDPLRNSRNPWFKEYWESIHDCVFEEEEEGGNVTTGPLGVRPSASKKRVCTGGEGLSGRQYTQESKMQFVFDAVYALAHALDRLLDARCGHIERKRSRVKCQRGVKVDGEALYKNYLLNLSFTDGHGAVVNFDRYGDGVGRYNIMNYRRNRTTRKYEYVTVGSWTSGGGLQMDPAQRVTWTGGGRLDLPASQCSRPCEHGHVKRVSPGEACCWVCAACDPWDVVEDEYTCVPCESGRWPSPDRRRCVELEQQHIRWDSPYAVVPAVLSGAGILFTGAVFVVFVRHFDSPVVRASGRELSLVLFAGFVVCYLQTFVLLARPGPAVCGAQRFGVGFGFAVTYSALLTKTNRISRIFDSARYSAQRPAFISPRSQVVITLLLVSVQAIGAAVWLVVEPPSVRIYHPFERRDEIVLKCGAGDQWLMLSLVYDALLIVVCTMYAVKTRKIPENFNESKYIGFTMYTTCIIWLAFVPIYFGTLNTFQVQITTLCISISLSATVALVCLFVPKLHVILFQADKNVRKLTMKVSASHKRSISSACSFSNPPPPSFGRAAAPPGLGDLHPTDIQSKQVFFSSQLTTSCSPGSGELPQSATDRALVDEPSREQRNNITSL